MDDERVDLTPLRLSADPARRERLKGSIRARTAGELARRSVQVTTVSTLARWIRPVLAGGGLLAAASLSALMLLPAPANPERAGPTDAFGVPAVVGGWLARDEGPDLYELMILFSGDDR